MQLGVEGGFTAFVRPILLYAATALVLAHSSGAVQGQVFDQPKQQAAQQRREAMVRDQIEARGVQDPRVLEAMRTVPRDRFIPPRFELEAYEDHPLPIGHGQTISQPYIVAYMSELLDLEESHRVLEIGTGSGYQAAVLGELAGEVYSIERIQPLAEQARRTLDELGYKNIHVRFGDGYLGWPEQAPFDRILLTAAPPRLPDALVEQLAPGGLLVAPVGGLQSMQKLIIVAKDARGRVSRSEDLPVRFVPMLEQTQAAP